jgi:hypothetical protein
MHKFLTTTLALGIVVGLVGCGNDPIGTRIDDEVSSSSTVSSSSLQPAQSSSSQVSASSSVAASGVYVLHEDSKTSNFPFGAGGDLGQWGAASMSDDATEKSVGSSSLKIAYSGDGGIFFAVPAGVDLSGYTALKFSIKADATAELKLESNGGSNGGGQDGILQLSDITGLNLDNTWQEVSVPLSDLTGLDLTKVTVLFGLHNGTGSVWLDDIRIE